MSKIIHSDPYFKIWKRNTKCFFLWEDVWNKEGNLWVGLEHFLSRRRSCFPCSMQEVENLCTLNCLRFCATKFDLIKIIFSESQVRQKATGYNALSLSITFPDFHHRGHSRTQLPTERDHTTGENSRPSGANLGFVRAPGWGLPGQGFDDSLDLRGR